MNTIYLTEKDHQRLHALVQAQRQTTGTHAVEALCKELKRAKVVPSEEIPVDVVTMNSFLRLRELKSSSVMEITITYPKDADLASRKISVLAPVATAILGCRVGDEIEWPAPNGSTVTYKVEEILYQPEAAGDFYL
ncbi:nucleoside diphosphate kinase regulator [Pontibacter sp. E15-1]|uniref:nucleoside diphosphate kinase regulator n=1 Tax=Pontibacter sp. E15-1 TaxID=2919918 RepID=UPI001F4FC5B7|nr:nucleoside diphosphate kinase regulator [Pontibacter sp. E15-1]MCJ8165675.1 nucleoside diphosphate kinase regulator [Pontibacter sp. E15-1]